MRLHIPAHGQRHILARADLVRDIVDLVLGRLVLEVYFRAGRGRDDAVPDDDLVLRLCGAGAGAVLACVCVRREGGRETHEFLPGVGGGDVDEDLLRVPIEQGLEVCASRPSVSQSVSPHIRDRAG